jgi:hypothetical protein
MRNSSGKRSLEGNSPARPSRLSGNAIHRDERFILSFYQRISLLAITEGLHSQWTLARGSMTHLWRGRDGALGVARHTRKKRGQRLAIQRRRTLTSRRGSASRRRRCSDVSGKSKRCEWRRYSQPVSTCFCPAERSGTVLPGRSEHKNHGSHATYGSAIMIALSRRERTGHRAAVDTGAGFRHDTRWM